ncbi:MAG: amidohydrolase [Candidatus Anstonellales archaeon]
MELCIRGGRILKGSGTLRADILVKDGVIEDIRKEIKHENSLDASGCFVIPGFYNSHTHVGMSILRGYAEGLDLHQWLTTKIWPAERKLTEEDVYWASLVSIAEMLHSGTVFFADMYFHTDSIAKAVLKSGIRASLGHHIVDANKKTEMGKAQMLLKKYRSSSQVFPAVAPHATYSCSKETFLECKFLSSQYGAKLFTHVSETRREVYELWRKERKRPIEYLHSLGILDSSLLMAHASWASMREIRMAGSAGSGIAHCPTSNLKLATGGICPAKKYIESGAKLMLGTDGPSSNNSQDIRQEIKLASLLQNHYFWKANSLLPEEALSSVTSTPASFFNTNGGSIEKGRYAELLVVPHTASLSALHSLTTSLVYSSYTVRDVVIGSKLVMENHKIITFSEQRAIEENEKRARRVAK